MLASAGGAGGGPEVWELVAVGVRRLGGQAARLSCPLDRFSEMLTTPPEEEQGA